VLKRSYVASLISQKTIQRDSRDSWAHGERPDRKIQRRDASAGEETPKDSVLGTRFNARWQKYRSPRSPIRFFWMVSGLERPGTLRLLWLASLENENARCEGIT
jgi:hypothetical protein